MHSFWWGSCDEWGRSAPVSVTIVRRSVSPHAGSAKQRLVAHEMPSSSGACTGRHAQSSGVCWFPLRSIKGNGPALRSGLNRPGCSFVASSPAVFVCCPSDCAPRSTASTGFAGIGHAHPVRRSCVAYFLAGWPHPRTYGVEHCLSRGRASELASRQKTTVSLSVAGLGLAGSVDAGRSVWRVTRKNNCPARVHFPRLVRAGWSGRR
ncbi:hypothetical protein IWX75_003401 [Arthrobacter sp. CAN_A6]